MVHCVWSGGQSLQLRYTDDVSLSAVGVPQAADEIQLLLPQYMLLHTNIYIYYISLATVPRTSSDAEQKCCDAGSSVVMLAVAL